MSVVINIAGIGGEDPLEAFNAKHAVALDVCQTRGFELYDVTPSALAFTQISSEESDAVIAMIRERDVLMGDEKEFFAVFGKSTKFALESQARISQMFKENAEMPVAPPTPGPREWIISNMLMRGQVTAWAATGGTYKTTAAKSLAISIASGSDILGLGVEDSCKVYAMNLEDTPEESARKTAALKLVDNAQINEALWKSAGRIFEPAGRGAKLTLGRISPEGEFDEADIRHLRTFCKAHDIGCIIIDPFFITLGDGISENSNDDLKKVMTALNQLAEAANVAILIILHVAKNTNASDVEAIRGASAIGNHVRSAWGLSTMTADQADDYGVKQSHRGRYVQIFDTKQNMAGRGHVHWFRAELVDLQNATKERKSDLMPVPIPWTPPSVARFAEGASMILTTKVSDLISEALDASETPDLTKLPIMVAKNSQGWIGKLIADHCMPESFTSDRVKPAVAEELIASAALIQVEAKTASRTWKQIYIHSAARHDSWFKAALGVWIRHPEA